jgi:hypothetical protein
MKIGEGLDGGSQSGFNSPGIGSENAARITPPSLPQDSSEDAPAAEQKARRWAALLTGNFGLKDCSVEFARGPLTDWLAQSAEGTFVTISSFPEIFQTTRFGSEIKAVESPLRFLKTVLDGLRSGALSYFAAIDLIGRNFGWNEERLFQWKLGLENLAGLNRWLPGFVHAHGYLIAAFPLGDEKLDLLRGALLQSVEEPHRFLQPNARDEFDNGFLEFKKGYMDAYFLLHEDELHAMAGMKKEEPRVDPVALRNLDFLSGLHYSDKSYLNRVKLLAKWIQQNQCNLPVHEILELYPRCYCNFNPASRQQPASSVTRINGIIQEGLDYFRTLLRSCEQRIRQELDSQSTDQDTRREIKAILGAGPMIPLKPQCIKILNRMIAKNSGEFLSEIRKRKKQITW